MTGRRKNIATLVARISPSDGAAGDWRAWVRLPRCLAARLAAIDQIAGTLTVGYPRFAEKRPTARIAPCQLLDAARLPVATLRRLQALERSHSRRYVLVAYRLTSSPAISRR